MGSFEIGFLYAAQRENAGRPARTFVANEFSRLRPGEAQGVTQKSPARAEARTRGRVRAVWEETGVRSVLLAERLVAELEASGFVIMRKPKGGGSRRGTRRPAGPIRRPRI
jgi:hypothetical protein